MKAAPVRPFSSPEVRVVEASAGSGKTFALAKRYVQLLLNPALESGQIPLRAILAITFTNKAAFEMKARILYFLKKTALKILSPEEEKEILVPLELSPEAASPRAALITRQIIHHYNFFQVQTIDSFVNALLSGCAFKIGLSANFRIRTDSGEYLEYSLDRMIDLAAGDKKVRRVFDRFIHQYLFLENKTGWFPRQDILGLMSALYQQSNIYGRDFTTDDYQPDKLFQRKKDILERVRKLNDRLPGEADGRFVKALGNFVSANRDSFDIDTLSAYFDREVLPVRKGAKVPASVQQSWEKIRAKLKELSEREAVSLFNPYIEMFNLSGRIFRDEAVKDDVLFLEQLNKETRHLFDEEAVTVEELYYRLAARFRHYLMDEFQDTSVLQWRNLFLMVEEALSTGGTLFYVGDKKQAIYGFRGGESRLFEHIKKEFAPFNVRVEQLAKNYRSQAAIVKFNNHVFSLENLERFVAAKEHYEEEHKKKYPVAFTGDDVEQLRVVFGTSQQEPRPDKPGGYVKVERVEEKKKETRDEIIRLKLIALVRELKKRVALSDIAILTRGNKEVEQMTSWLLEEGVFVESERTLNIRENPLIGELIAFLKFLHSPIDNIAFADFILGDVFAAVSGLGKDRCHAFIFERRARLRAEGDLYLYREFREAFPDIWDKTIDEFFRNVGLYPLYELVMSAIERLEVLRNFPGQQGFVMRFLELIKKQEEETSDVGSFLERFEEMHNEELYVNVSDTDAIRILTIHKSKGLEFPVVIVPFLGMDAQVGTGSSDMGQRSFVLDFQEERLRLLRIKNRYLGFSDELREVHHREYVQSFLSELNSVYVALTRAERELYVFVPDRVGTAFNFINFLIPGEVMELGRPAAKGARDKKPPTPREKIPVSEYRDWIDYLKDEFMTADEVVNRARIRRGEVLHAILAGVEVIGKKSEIKGQIKEAAAKARAEFPHVRDWAEYEKEIEGVLAAPGLKEFFSPGGAEIANEKEVIDRTGRTRRIDRLIVKPREVWVVDYKSTREPALHDGYLGQVREYMGIVKDIYPGRRARGFLLYLDEKKAEEVG